VTSLVIDGGPSLRPGLFRSGGSVSVSLLCDSRTIGLSPREDGHM
jgi:hypothetical protein